MHNQPHKYALYYHQYLERKTLAKLGYTDSIEDLDCFTAYAFVIVDDELARLRNKKEKQANSKAGGSIRGRK